jgi:hypothetical protein
MALAESIPACGGTQIRYGHRNETFVAKASRHIAQNKPDLSIGWILAIGAG